MRKCLVVLLSVALTACASTGPVARAARAQQNTAVVLAFLDMVFNRHDVETAFKLYVGPEYRQHNPTVADGRVGAIQFLTRLTHEIYPELRQEVKRTVSQGDLVAVHSRYLRTAGDRSSARGLAVVDMFRLERGRIVEHWDVTQEIPETSANENTMF
jgi:predicted SnoaL-like aldol condensation-catalyzing enzyme